LTLTKSTKGTHVYTMVKDGVEMGSVYMPKLVLPADPPAKLDMIVSIPA
jgi:hypothetical protein